MSYCNIDSFFNYSQDNIKKMNSTSRARGSVGANAVVPKIVEQIASPEDRILDLGSGKHAIHAQQLLQLGFDVVAFEIGNNYNPQLHDSCALNFYDYDIIYTSNVINVQTHIEHVQNLLEVVISHLKDGGKYVCNYPAEPRYLPGMTTRDFEDMLKLLFYKVEKIKKVNSPTWVCR